MSFMHYLLATSILLVVVSTLPGEISLDEDRQMMQGLVERQLFELAERYSAERIVAPGLTDRHQAELAAELVQAYALHALNAPQQQQSQRWNAALAIAPQFQTQFPEQSATVVVHLQDAIARMMRARQLREQDQLIDAKVVSSEAVQAFLDIQSRLQDLKSEVDELLRDSYQASSPQAAFTSDQLLALSRRSAFLMAEALQQLAHCYPRDSVDRIGPMAEALRQIEPLTTLRPESGILWSALLLEIRCLRDLGKTAQSDAKAQQLLEQMPPAAVALQARAEQIRVAVEENNAERTTHLINLGREIEGQSSPELDFAIFEAYLQFWQSAEAQNDAEGTKRWQNECAAVIQQLDQLHGSYWARKAEQMLTRTASTGDTQNVALLKRTAENYVRKQAWSEALRNYDLAISAAAAKSDLDTEYQLRLTAAAAAVQANQLEEAIQRFREAATRFPAADDSPKYHLTAAYYQSVLARQSTPVKLEPYLKLLQENLQLWPSGPAAEQAAMWTGQVEFSRGNWQQATKAYMLIDPESTQFGLAVDGVRQASLKWFQEDQAKDQLVQQDVQQVIKYLDKIVGAQNADPTWTPGGRLAAETSAQLWLNFMPRGYEAARKRLEFALNSAPEGPTGWRSRLQSLLVIALAGSGQHQQAKTRLLQIQQQNPRDLFEILQSLTLLSQTATVDVKKQMAELELEVVELLKPNLGQFDEVTQLAILSREAEAMSTLGEIAIGLQRYDELIGRFPQKIELLVGKARLLSRSEDQERALQQWRLVSRKATPQSNVWFLAKLEIARCHQKLGNSEEAMNMIRYLATLYPDLGGAEMKSAFVELSRQLSQ